MSFLQIDCVCVNCVLCDFFRTNSSSLSLQTPFVPKEPTVPQLVGTARRKNLSHRNFISDVKVLSPLFSCGLIRFRFNKFQL